MGTKSCHHDSLLRLLDFIHAPAPFPPSSIQRKGISPHTLLTSSPPNQAPLFLHRQNFHLTKVASSTSSNQAIHSPAHHSPRPNGGLASCSNDVITIKSGFSTLPVIKLTPPHEYHDIITTTSSDPSPFPEPFSIEHQRLCITTWMFKGWELSVKTYILEKVVATMRYNDVLPRVLDFVPASVLVPTRKEAIFFALS